MVVANKIDTLKTENKPAYLARVKEFLVRYFDKEGIQVPPERIVPVSCKEETNIFLRDVPEMTEHSFSDVVMTISERVAKEREDDLLHQYLPTRFSVLCTNKILGTGIIAQGFMLSGEVCRKDEVIILPGMVKAQIDGIESYGSRTEGKGLSKILGLNLKGIYKENIAKGNVIILAREFEEWKMDEKQSKMVQMKETILNMNLNQM